MFLAQPYVVYVLKETWKRRFGNNKYSREIAMQLQSNPQLPSHATPSLPPFSFTCYPTSQHLLPSTATQQLTVFIGSWNMGNTLPQNDLSTWIPANAYDIYCIGVQECHYKLSSGSSCEQHWFSLVQQHCGNNYVRIAALSLRHMRLIVLCRESHKQYVNNVTTATEGSGLGSLYGNKGGVGVSFTLYNQSYCFINVHLAALSKLNRRVEDIQQILGRMKLSTLNSIDITQQFDSLFLLGDLNFRLQSSPEPMLQAVDASDYSTLLQHDELCRLMQKGETLYGWREQLITFMPTYKYVTNKKNKKKSKHELQNLVNEVEIEDNQETLSQLSGRYLYNSKRIPAYCDRILTHSRTTLSCQVTNYSAINTIYSSDHKPVRCEATIYRKRRPGKVGHTVTSGGKLRKLGVRMFTRIVANLCFSVFGRSLQHRFSFTLCLRCLYSFFTSYH